MPHSFPTIDEAVENFRRELFRKEADTGGIIDAPTVVYSDFKNKTLIIYCHHYNAVSNTNERNLVEKNYLFERDFSDDEEDEPNPTSLQLVRPIGTYNINDYQQVLHMNIQ